MDILYIVLIAVISQFGMNIVSDKIGYQYSPLYKWLAIVANTGIWILLFQKLGWSPTLGVVGLASTILLTSSFIDLKYQEIPNSYNLAVALLGGGFIYIYQDYYEQLLLGGVIAFLLFLMVMIFTGAMGGGDVKMAGGIGLFTGTFFVSKFIVYAFFSGAIIAVLLLIFKRKSKNDVFPFGPCIALSGIYMFIAFI
ncbi:hypothetical protein CVD28_24445 [Bacillus sp. M6-12]|uniref:prepilin peptidase n=1 Tax=Bacillus sp. M6-12 TaxID=2054166 RepID=UPI000C75A6ED|nr:A24 family peptidase [Bacillus sp. M6-12]PLS15033.1 hypothetical protein CVD28_24445 [Bacillus sp. M6-12]